MVGIVESQYLVKTNTEIIKQKQAPIAIKTIVFDLGGVVFTDGSMLAVKKIKNALHLKEDDYKLIEDCFSNDQGSIGRLIRTGQISYEEFENEFAERLKIKDSKKRMIRHLWFSSYVPNYRMTKIIKKLKKDHKLRLVVFSGNVRERISYLKKRFKVFKYFNDEVYSYDYKTNKRDLGFYEELLDHIEYEPSETILIDDSYKNIKRAKLVGMHGIHYVYTEKLVEDLKKFGINLKLKKIKMSF